MTPGDKLAALRALYESVYGAVESFEVDDCVGADLAYLLGAILIGGRCEWTSDRAILGVLRALRDEPTIAYALEHVRIREG